MQTISPLALLHGRDVPLPQLRWLNAGPLTAALDGIDLRYVRLGDLELVRRIYVGVRDCDWNTIPAVASELDVHDRPDSFDVRFSVRHTSHDIDFSWHGHIAGTPDGHVSYTMEGQGEREMLYNRIGFCVLQPWREYVGRPFRGETPDGPVSGTLPTLVGPQRFENGVYVPLFPSVSRLEIELAEGPVAIFEFQGDLFETDDQRNWSDASFKTYSTPLALGLPHELKPGRALSQTVTVHAEGEPEATARPHRGRIELGEPTGARVPPVGLKLATGGGPSEAEAALLAALAPAHLRADVHLADPAWPELLQRASAACARTNAALELALFLRPEDTAALEQLREALAGATVTRVLVLPEGAQTATPEETTPPELVALVRERLALGGVPFAGGTDMFFCELNRTKPQVEAMDGVFWSVNPQVHAFDDISLFETLEAQGEQVRAAKAFAGGKQIFVGPVTLERRPNVDPRQASLLGAAWTLASAKHLSEQGADAVTYFETTGLSGVVQADEAFPLYHVLADVCSLRGAEVLACASGRPLELNALAVRRDGGTTLLVANLTHRPHMVELAGVGEGATMRRLNEATAEQARLEPQRFRAAGEPLPASGMLELGPYETARIDI
jgi:hypothetical protein